MGVPLIAYPLLHTTPYLSRVKKKLNFDKITENNGGILLFKVEFISKRVKKEFQSFTKAEQQGITDAMNLLSTNPRPIHLGFGTE
jgi:hypothetical protein